MSKDIIGGVVALGLPKPDLMQNNPKKGDYVWGKDDFLKQIPVAVAEDGYTDITGLRKPTLIRAEREGKIITVTARLQGERDSISTIVLDDQDYPLSVISDGVECALEFVGFDVEAKWLYLANYGLSPNDVLVDGVTSIAVTAEQQTEINGLLMSSELLGLNITGVIGEGEATYIYQFIARADIDGVLTCYFSSNGFATYTVSCTNQILSITKYVE